jgi:hypothetical protein
VTRNGDGDGSPETSGSEERAADAYQEASPFQPAARKAFLGEAGILELVGEDHIYPTVRAGVEAVEASERGEDASSGRSASSEGEGETTNHAPEVPRAGEGRP